MIVASIHKEFTQLKLIRSFKCFKKKDTTILCHQIEKVNVDKISVFQIKNERNKPHHENRFLWN